LIKELNITKCLILKLTEFHHPKHIIRHFDFESFQPIHFKFEDKCGQDWRKVPEDILIQILAEYQNPKWSITLSDKLMKYLRSFKDRFKADEEFTADENWVYLVNHVQYLALDVEIYRQGLSQQVYKRRIELRKLSGNTLGELSNDYVLMWRLGLTKEDVKNEADIMTSFTYVMGNSQRPSDEQIFIPHKMSIYRICEGMGMNKQDSYLTLFEILKQLDYKNYRTADINKECNKLKAEHKVFRDRWKESIQNSFKPLTTNT